MILELASEILGLVRNAQLLVLVFGKNELHKNAIALVAEPFAIGDFRCR